MNKTAGSRRFAARVRSIIHSVCRFGFVVSTLSLSLSLSRYIDDDNRICICADMVRAHTTTNTDDYVVEALWTPGVEEHHHPQTIRTHSPYYMVRKTCNLLQINPHENDKVLHDKSHLLHILTFIFLFLAARTNTLACHLLQRQPVCRFSRRLFVFFFICSNREHHALNAHCPNALEMAAFLSYSLQFRDQRCLYAQPVRISASQLS